MGRGGALIESRIREKKILQDKVEYDLTATLEFLITRPSETSMEAILAAGPGMKPLTKAELEGASGPHHAELHRR